MQMAKIVRKLCARAGRSKTFMLDACGHGGMTELEEVGLTDGQGRALVCASVQGIRGLRQANLEKGSRRDQAATGACPGGPLNRNKTAQNLRMGQRNGFRMTQSPGARTLLNRLTSDKECARMATWRSGYAAVCKTVYPGSIPGVASSQQDQALTSVSSAPCPKSSAPCPKRTSTWHSRLVLRWRPWVTFGIKPGH
jgi:hypothetical protein